jgi:hypothetical protein
VAVIVEFLVVIGQRGDDAGGRVENAGEQVLPDEAEHIKVSARHVRELMLRAIVDKYPPHGLAGYVQDVDAL